MRYTKTDQSLYKWLCVSTGRALCDSGDAYGRNWQRNQKLKLADFRKQKCVIEVSAYLRQCTDYHPELNGTKQAYVDGATIPLFHYLHELMCELEIDARCKKYMQWWEKYGDTDWELGDNGIFAPDEAIEYAGLEAMDACINTYNNESHLSQVIQYNTFRAKDNHDDMYLGIAIHQGCDVRGGYTYGRIFKLSDYHTGTNIYLNVTPTVMGSIGEVDIDIGSEVMFYQEGNDIRLDTDEMYDLFKTIIPDGKSSATIEADWCSDGECIYVG